MADFREVQRASLLPDQIASEIRAKVAAGDLKPGDTLPTEHALAEKFGVSRNVVREAIARLRADGVIDSRQGRGAVVKPISERETFRVDIQSLGKSDNLADLYELRCLLEIEAAGLAAERRTGADLDEIRETLFVMEGQRDFDEQRLEADAAFHRAIGKATGNNYLYAIISYIASRLKDTTRATSDIYGKDDLLEVTLVEHRKIFDAIETGDGPAAREAMAGHVQSAAGRLRVQVKWRGV